ncbi:branched-chain amino acid ABC transporter permease [Stappia stellulata]|uniref:branched-chain amino acid ABC transporter permease n=1 Tax=Stappia TaxID=152161 RepID=UPI001CD5F052|nr:branched-chain amino acid ABC transporter permease [Stappia stellulata]MCA1244213.1 branched-chain amino acid ABC transporter permease [Stappia stellulata]
MLSEIAIIVVRGVAIGSLFAIIAMSFNIVHNATRILNFAQGNIFILGGFAAYFLADNAGFPTWLLMLVVTGLVMAVLVAMQGWLTLLPLRGNSAEQDSWMISTVSVSVIIAAILMLVYGPFAYSVGGVVPAFRIFGVKTPGAFLLAIAAMLGCYFLLSWFLRHSFTGLAISALSQDFDAARAAGLNVRGLQLLAFGISGLIAGSAGFMVAPMISVSPDAGLRYVLNGFIAAVIGGIGNNTGALIGGPLVGVMAMLMAYKVGGAYQDLASLIVLVVILMFWPQGLFGRATARRV